MGDILKEAEASITEIGSTQNRKPDQRERLRRLSRSLALRADEFRSRCDAYEHRIEDLESRIIWTVSSLQDMIKYCDSRKLQEEYANVIAIAEGRK